MDRSKKQRVMQVGIEEDRFLFLGSEFNLVCIDLKKTQESCTLSFNPPMAEVAWISNIHATSTGDCIPFGMSSTRYNFRAASSVLVPCSSSTQASSEILLIGGELQDPSSPFVSVQASKEVYKIVPEVTNSGDIKNIKIDIADPDIPRMNGDKACPIVEEIAGNLYVLHTRFMYHSFDKVCDIPFEVFDANIGYWRTLPTPPFFAAQVGVVIYAHAVIGHCIAIETSKQCFSFDTVTEEWYSSEDMTGYLINRLPMTVPTGLPRFGIDGHGRPLYVGFSLTIEPFAYLVMPDGTILSSQSLQHVIYEDILPCPDDPLDRNVLIPLKPSAKDVDAVRMCACSLVYHNNFPDGQALVISIFSAKISTWSQQLILQMIYGEVPNVNNHPAYSSFLEVVVEKKFILRVPHIGYSFNGPALML